jgi:hypothetical protein
MATAAPLLFLLLGVRCVSDFVSTPEQPFSIGRKSVVVVRPQSAALEGVGAVVQLSGEAVDENGFVLAGAPIRWRSLNDAIATVDSVAGTVTTVSSGQAIIEAHAGGNVRGYALVTVGVLVSPPLTGLDSAPGVTVEQLNAVWGTSPSNVYAVGAFGTIVHFDGQSWSPIDLAHDAFHIGLATRHLWGVWGSSANDIYIVGDSGMVLHCESPPGGCAQNGPAWSVVAVQTKQSLHDVWGAAPRDVYFVGDGGTILHYDGRWHADTSGTTMSLRGIWGASSEDMWAVGDGGTVLHRTGAGWTAEASHSAAVLTDVWGTSAAQVIAVGGGGTALRREGGAWTVEPTGTGEALNAVWGTSSRAAVAVGESGTLLRFTGTEWQPVSGTAGTGLHAVFGFSTGEIFLGGGAGTLLLTSSNTGAHLVFSAVPAQPVIAGADFPVEVRVVDGTGNAIGSATDTVTLALVADTSGAQLLGTTSVAAVQGVARFTLSLQKAGARYVLSATAPGHATARSPSFAVAPAAAAQLEFLVQPSNTPKDSPISPAPQVAAVDLYGNLVWTYTRDVTVTLGFASPCGGLNPLAENTRTPVRGVATFDQLHPSAGGTGCNLTATTYGLASAFSDYFQVTATGPALSVSFAPEEVVASTRDLLSSAVDVRDALGNRIPPFTIAATPARPYVVTYLDGAELPSGMTSGAVPSSSFPRRAEEPSSDPPMTPATRSRCGPCGAARRATYSWWGVALPSLTGTAAGARR